MKAYADLLDPKWKGKIIMGDPSQAGGTGRFFLMTRGKVL